MIRRIHLNPIIKPSDIQPLNDQLEVMGVFNPGAVLFNKKTILILRVAEKCREEKGWIKVPVFERNENGFGIRILKWKRNSGNVIYDKDPRYFTINKRKYLSSVSYFLIAESSDGENFKITENKILPSTVYETFGIEDPRITKLGDIFAVTYTSVSEYGYYVSLKTTNDFTNFIYKGIILPPENKDACLFPEMIHGKYYCLHRPGNVFIGKPSIWIAESYDLANWGNHKCLLKPEDLVPEPVKIGAGPPPVKTPEGWLLFFHSCNEDSVYTLHIALLDLNNPLEILKVKTTPLLEPETEYEKEGIVSNVVFSNGWVVHPDGRVNIYYGAADFCTALAQTTVPELLNFLK